MTISLPDRDLFKLGAIGGVDEAGVEALGDAFRCRRPRVYYGRSHP